VEGELESAASGRLESRKLCDVPQLVIVGQRHPLSSHARIALRDLDAQAFVMRQPGSHTRLWLDQVLRAAQVTPHVIAEFDNPEAIKRTVMNGKAVGILPEYAVRADVRRGMLRVLPTEAPLARALSVIWDKAMPQSAIARAFLERVDTCLHEVG
jgi:DNA-binding transcriptional LysR family regulator